MRYAVAMTRDRREGMAVEIREGTVLAFERAAAAATGALFGFLGAIELVDVAIVAANSHAAARACALGV